MRRRQLPRVGRAVAVHSSRPHAAAEVAGNVYQPRVRPFGDRINGRRGMSESLEASASLEPPDSDAQSIHPPPRRKNPIRPTFLAI
jgi:hypothetical protein